MKEKKYFGLSEDEQQEIWLRHKRGETLSDIGRALTKNPSCIHRLIGHYGGIAPKLRKSASRQLNLEEREEISRGLNARM